MLRPTADKTSFLVAGMKLSFWESAQKREAV
jgi:hypothetical protein